MQAQRRIAVPPVVAYPLVLLAHQRGDAEELEARADLEAALPAADDEHRGVPVDELALARALLEPLAVVRRKVAARARRLGVPAQALEVREHVVRAPAARDGHEPRDAAAGAGGALARVVHAHPREVLVEGVRLREREREVAQLRLLQAVVQERADARRALERAQVPRHREQVAPPGVVGEEREDAVDVVLRDLVLELLEPLRRDLRGVRGRDILRRDAEVLRRREVGFLVLHFAGHCCEDWVKGERVS